MESLINRITNALNNDNAEHSKAYFQRCRHHNSQMITQECICSSSSARLPRRIISLFPSRFSTKVYSPHHRKHRCLLLAQRIVALIVNTLTEDEETTTIQHYPEVKRARILQQSLWVSIQKSHSITAILLAPYIEGDAYFDEPSDILPANKSLQKVRGGDYASFARQTCLKLLSSKVSTEARQGISRCLQQKQPKVFCLSAECQTFSAHKDVLSHWSLILHFYSKDQFTDSEHVEFGQDMSATSISPVLRFAYCGTFKCKHRDITTGEQIIEFEDLLVAADYFGIDCLEQEVEECLDLLVT
ncbi:unnamed protein product [Aspergillus oryzae]|nr:unnamed protein product [Aspergillus oryzae]